MKKISIVFILICITICLAGCKKTQEPTNQNASNEKEDFLWWNDTKSAEAKDDKKISNDSYEANIYFDGDHYVLNIMTNLMDKELKLTYNYKEFLLDNTSEYLADVEFKENGDKKSFSLMLNSNNIYEFNFISINGKELSFEDYLEIQ